MPLGLGVLCALSLAQSPAADSLYHRAQGGDDQGLIIAARARPLLVREAVTAAMAKSVRPGREAGGALAAARRLAGAVAAVWRDSFLLGQVDRFGRLSSVRRLAKVRADSLRLAGVAAYSRSGPASAIVIWRRAFDEARGIGDTAGMAAALDNIGAGLASLGRLDSAGRSLEAAKRLAAAVGDVRVQANAIGHLADLSADRGDQAQAREGYARARVLRDRVGDSRGAAADLNNLGLVAQNLGDLAEARSRYQQALALNRREGRDDAAATNVVNLAGLASLEGDLANANALYRDALAAWRARGDWSEAAVALLGIGQLEMRRGDYPAARVALTEALSISARTGPPAEALRAQRALAEVLAAAGDLQGARDQLARAQSYADSAQVPDRARAALMLGRADLAIRFNAVEEAEALYREADRLSQRAGDVGGALEARRGLGVGLLEYDDPRRAKDLLASVLRAQLASGNRRAAELTRLTLGRAVWQAGEPAPARRMLADAARGLDRLGDPVAAGAALGQRAVLEAHAGFPVVAESLYRAAIAAVGGRLAPEVGWQLRGGLALALRSQGNLPAAAREFRSAVAEVERSASSLVVPEYRSAYLADKWDVYAQLVLTERDRGLTGAAFEVSERLRAREMLDLLGRGRVPAVSEAAPELVGQEQDLRRRISELTWALDSGRSAREAVRGPDVSRSAEAVRQPLLRTQAAYSDLLLAVRERAPRHAALVAPKEVAWRDVARRLAPDQALVTYFVSDSGSIAFVVVRDSSVAVDLGAGRRELARLVDFARGAVERPRSDTLWRGPFRRLYSYLIEPVEETGLLAGKTRLVVVPHAELNYLPFAALTGGEAPARFLGERYELSVTPSASVWLALGDRPKARPGSGVLAFAPRPDALPASRREVAAIARLAGSDVLVWTGGEATEAMFRREAPTRRIIHLATYGVLNKQNPLFSFVELAPGGGQDGRLEVHEVFGLSLSADLVVLSACQTALASGSLADVPAGDDWVGLTRAFLHAGAGSVLATLWPVDDWATAGLMERFYQSMSRGATAAQALRAAQRAVSADPSTADPFYWAGFVLVAGADGPSS